MRQFIGRKTHSICFWTFITESTHDSRRITWWQWIQVSWISHLKLVKWNSRVSYIFDEDTGESEILPGMAFVYYYRPIMILVDHDFCQSKWIPKKFSKKSSKKILAQKIFQIILLSKDSFCSYGQSKIYFTRPCRSKDPLITGKKSVFVEVLRVFSTWTEVWPVIWMWTVISIVIKCPWTKLWWVINSFTVLVHHIIVSSVNTSKNSMSLERTIVQVGVGHPSCMSAHNCPEILMWT